MNRYDLKTPDELCYSIQQEFILLDTNIQDKLIKNLVVAWEMQISMNQYRNKNNREFSRIRWLLVRLIQSIFTRNPDLEKFKLDELHKFVHNHYFHFFDLLYKHLSEDLKLYEFSIYKGLSKPKVDNMAQK